MGIEGWEDAPLSCPHVEASKPEVILLSLHQNRVIHIELQLICMSRDEPEAKGRGHPGLQGSINPWQGTEVIQGCRGQSMQGKCQRSPRAGGVSQSRARNSGHPGLQGSVNSWQGVEVWERQRSPGAGGVSKARSKAIDLQRW